MRADAPRPRGSDATRLGGSDATRLRGSDATRLRGSDATRLRGSDATRSRPRVRANPAQLSFSWGGAREGAGRPARGPIVSERHRARPALAPWFPVHVIARLDRSVRVLGRREAYATIRRAVNLSLARTNFRIVRLAIHAHRLELLVEADDKVALARGMQGFQVSAARAMNRAARRTGTVFPDRYRMTILRTRSAARASVRAAMRAAIAIACPVLAESALARAVEGLVPRATSPPHGRDGSIVRS